MPPMRPGRPGPTAAAPAAVEPQPQQQQQPSQAPQPDQGGKQDPGLSAAVDPHKLPPRPVTLPLDLPLALLNPAPTFAYHSGDRRFIWPLVLVEFLAACLWFEGTNAHRADTLADTFDTFIAAPIKLAVKRLQALPSKDFSKTSVWCPEVIVAASVALHVVVVMAAVTRVLRSTQRQANAVFVLRPVHFTDFVLLAVDDSAMSAMHSPSRPWIVINSLMRAGLILNFLPGRIVDAVVRQKFTFSKMDGFMMFLQAAFAAAFLYQHIKVAGMTSTF